MIFWRSGIQKGLSSCLGSPLWMQWDVSWSYRHLRTRLGWMFKTAPSQDDYSAAWWELSWTINWVPTHGPSAWKSTSKGMGFLHGNPGFGTLAVQQKKPHHLFWPSLRSQAMSLFWVLLITRLPRSKRKSHGPHLGIRGVSGTSLMVQWSRLPASNAGGVGLIPGWGTKIPQPTGCSQTYFCF